MTYRLEPQDPVSDSVRQVASSQISDILSAFGDAPPSAKAVHETRKSVKRLRALLSLVRHGLDDYALRREKDRLRAIAHSLAGARDTHVMAETARELSDKGLPRDCRAAGRTILDLLGKQRDASGADLMERMQLLPLDKLREAQEAMDALPVETLSFSEVLKGFVETYRRGRRLHREVFASNEDDERIHDFRKEVQQHWRHLQLLTNAWPKGLRPLIALARQLSETLGKDHDMAMLAAFVSETARAEGEDKAKRFEAYLGICSAEQAALRRRAELMARRLYAEKPKSLRRRIKTYWQTAEGMEAKPSLRNGHDRKPAAGKQAEG